MDYPSARPIAPAGVKPVEVPPAVVGERIRKLLLDRELTDTGKVSAIALELSAHSSNVIHSAVSGLLQPFQDNQQVLAVLAQGLQQAIQGVAGAHAPAVRSESVAPPMQGSAAPPEAKTALAPRASTDELAQFFRPRPEVLQPQVQLAQRLSEALGPGAMQTLPALSKAHSEVQKQAKILTKSYPDGSPELLAAMQALEASPAGQKLVTALAQIPVAAQGMFVKVLEHECFKIGKDPVERAQQALALLPGVTAIRDMQIATGVLGLQQNAAVFKAVERLLSPPRKGADASFGQQAVFHVAQLKQDSSDWGSIEGAMQSPVSLEARQAAITAARSLQNGWGPIQAIAPVLGFANSATSSDVRFDPENLARWTQESVYLTLQQGSAQQAVPVFKAYENVFAAARPIAQARSEIAEAFMPEGIALLALIAPDAPAWSDIEGRLGRAVSPSQRELIGAAARQLNALQPYQEAEASSGGIASQGLPFALVGAQNLSTPYGSAMAV